MPEMPSRWWLPRPARGDRPPWSAAAQVERERQRHKGSCYRDSDGRREQVGRVVMSGEMRMLNIPE